MSNYLNDSESFYSREEGVFSPGIKYINMIERIQKEIDDSIQFQQEIEQTRTLTRFELRLEKIYRERRIYEIEQFKHALLKCGKIGKAFHNLQQEPKVNKPINTHKKKKFIFF